MYLDPGFGSMVIQLLIAGIAAAGSFFYIFRQKLKIFFIRLRNKKNKSKAEEDVTPAKFE
ncbi:hypothetical protein TREPR_3729 [Treponema primitia ZAS-2]|uniref:Uncharacterized protein n=1 Tax=Treponema primitia (strain ATCC BAA-887 / DSM 12427 / ZAS-2) TaxID=545694 RepID=F5YQB1_TREPZ|nr:hypothetical protein TREPR_3729 [Treponema primitia ZAS-2]